MAGMIAGRYYQEQRTKSDKTLEKLSSGYRIDHAADDAAGLSVSEKMRAQITGLDGAIRNARDGLALIQTGEGAMQEVHSMLDRLYELASRSANGTYQDSTDRTSMQAEVSQLTSEIDRIAKSANFNGIPLFQDEGYEPGHTTPNYMFYLKEDHLSGATYPVTVELLSDDGALIDRWSGLTEAAFTGKSSGYSIWMPGGDQTLRIVDADGSVSSLSLTFSKDAGTWYAPGDPEPPAVPPDHTNVIPIQIGSGGKALDEMQIPKFYFSARALGLTDLDVSTQDQAVNALDGIASMIDRASEIRARYGAHYNALSHTIAYMNVTALDLQDAESHIRDAAMAKEMSDYTRLSIVGDSVQAMVAQANQDAGRVLDLLRG